jgi:hypothetical protein
LHHRAGRQASVALAKWTVRLSQECLELGEQLLDGIAAPERKPGAEGNLLDLGMPPRTEPGRHQLVVGGQPPWGVRINSFLVSTATM